MVDGVASRVKGLRPDPDAAQIRVADPARSDQISRKATSQEPAIRAIDQALVRKLGRRPLRPRALVVQLMGATRGGPQGPVPDALPAQQ